MKKNKTKLFKITTAAIFFFLILLLFIKESESQLTGSIFTKQYFNTKSDAPHSFTCNACHLIHNSTGNVLTTLAGNDNLCMSCHNPSGTASSLSFSVADIADPAGNTGTSHAWNVPAVNTTYETNLPVNTEMSTRINSGEIICSTCHDQHLQAFSPFLRADNTGDAICKDCHSARDIGRYTDDNINHKGSHPVGLVYDGSNSKLNPTPSAPLQLVGLNIECSSCHQVHYSVSTDGNILRTTNDNTLCTSCHTYGSHNGFSCNDCHQAHNTVKDNIYMIKDVVNSNSVNFYTETGINSFGDEDGTEDGICEVCHTGTSYHLADGTGASHNPTSNCTACHPHEDNFAPGGCSECHTVAFPDWGVSDSHFAHTDKYTYACNTCHLNYGSGGSLEGTHPNSTLNGDSTMNFLVSAQVNFDPSGLARRNGNDGNTPTYAGSGGTCSNVYCHSNGVSADRATDGTYTWGGLPFGTVSYATTPAWTAGTITACTPCHAGVGNMTSPYTITPPGPLISSADDYPPTGEHRKGQHYDLTQNISYSGGQAQCFFCHNTESSTVDAPRFQGTYGTSLHVDGETHFSPVWLSNGGTMIDTWTYSYDGSATHCGNKKSCW